MQKITRLFLGALLLPFILQAQTVTTIATNTGIDDGMALDSEGNLYGSNYMGNSVFKLTPDGTVSTFSTGYDTPNGLVFNNDGTLFMADNIGNVIYKIMPNGTSEAFVANINNPSGLIFEHDSDTLIVTGYLGDKLSKIAPDGSVIQIPGTNVMNGPVGLAYDDGNNLYVAEFGNSNGFGSRKIFKITPEGEISTLMSLNSGGSIGFIAYAKGYLYATAFYSNRIYRIDLAGNAELWLGSTAGTVDGDASVAKFNGPNGIIASPSQDTLYVSDFNTRSIRMITDLEMSTPVNQTIASIDIDVYPNPVSDILNVEYPTTFDNSDRIFFKMNDAAGKLIFSQQLDRTGQMQISRSPQWPSGIYFYEVKGNGAVLGNGKVVLK